MWKIYDLAEPNLRNIRQIAIITNKNTCINSDFTDIPEIFIKMLVNKRILALYMSNRQLFLHRSVREPLTAFPVYLCIYNSKIIYYV